MGEVGIYRAREIHNNHYYLFRIWKDYTSDHSAQNNQYQLSQLISYFIILIIAIISYNFPGIVYSRNIQNSPRMAFAKSDWNKTNCIFINVDFASK